MKKLLGFVVLGLLLSGCGNITANPKTEIPKSDMEGFAKKYAEWLKKNKTKKNICKNEVKDMTGSEAIEKYEECLKRK